MSKIAKAMAKAMQRDVRCILALLAFISLLVAVGVGVPLGIFLAKFFKLSMWLSALPGAGFALFIAGIGVWASMAEGRLPFLRGRKPWAGA